TNQSGVSRGSHPRAPQAVPAAVRLVAIRFAVAAIAVVLCVAIARAEDVVVPVSLQAELMAKVAAYDRNFASRAGTEAKILILTKSGDALSGRVGNQMSKALGELSDFGGVAHSETVATYSNAADLTATCKKQKYSVVYVAPGFDADVEAIAGALKGLSILSVSAVPGYVPKGIVLGFDSISGKSKLLV